MSCGVKTVKRALPATTKAFSDALGSVTDPAATETAESKARNILDDIT
jgi:hypothetical protein